MTKTTYSRTGTLLFGQDDVTMASQQRRVFQGAAMMERFEDGVRKRVGATLHHYAATRPGNYGPCRLTR